jgi:hypothetical protein
MELRFVGDHYGVRKTETKKVTGTGKRNNNCHCAALLPMQQSPVCLAIGSLRNVGVSCLQYIKSKIRGYSY